MVRGFLLKLSIKANQPIASFMRAIVADDMRQIHVRHVDFRFIRLGCMYVVNCSQIRAMQPFKGACAAIVPAKVINGAMKLKVNDRPFQDTCFVIASVTLISII